MVVELVGWWMYLGAREVITMISTMVPIERRAQVEGRKSFGMGEGQSSLSL